MRHLILLIALIHSGMALAMEPVTPDDAPVALYRSDMAYDDIKSNIEMAITGRGLLVSDVLHISDMLDRTAEDTGLGGKIYQKAESFEFCSVSLSHKMSSAHPANMSACPFTIGLYVLPDEPEQVYVTYRRPDLLGDAKDATASVIAILDGIVREALE